MSYLDLAKASIGNQPLTPDIKNNFPNQEFKGFRNLGGYGDSQLAPLDRPPSNETEVRRLIDFLADPVAFARWIERLMADGTEASICSECRQSVPAEEVFQYEPLVCVGCAEDV